MSVETAISHAMHGEKGFRPTDRVISELAERQHGIVGRRQLIDLGVGRGAIEGRLARGQLHRVHQGAYAVGHRMVSRQGRWMAAVLSGGSGAVLSHRSAGQLWQVLPQFEIWPELTRARKFSPRTGIRGHHSPLPPDEVAVVVQIPVTSVARTLLDLAGVLTNRQLEQALNETEVLGLTDRLSLPDLLERYPRRRGSSALRALLRDGSATRGVTRSKLERRFLALLDRADLPRPRLNAHVAVRGRFFEVDCLWRERQLIVELDGREVHGTELAFEKDRERDRLLLVEGWRVTRITWRQLRGDAATVIADLDQLLRV
jgi:very-short-patch-repair endonuclease